MWYWIDRSMSHSCLWNRSINQYQKSKLPAQLQEEKLALLKTMAEHDEFLVLPSNCDDAMCGSCFVVVRRTMVFDPMKLVWCILANRLRMLYRSNLISNMGPCVSWGRPCFCCVWDNLKRRKRQSPADQDITKMQPHVFDELKLIYKKTTTRLMKSCYLNKVLHRLSARRAESQIRRVKSVQHWSCAGSQVPV